MGCKVRMVGTPCFEHGKFYLNYVGCKVVVNILVRDYIIGFYLNYVGCKVACKLKSLFCMTSCFTLTMWDVKISILKC